MKGHFERNPDVMSPALNSLLRDMAIENELTLVRPPAGGVARGGLLAASLMRSAQKVLPFIRGSRNPHRPVFHTGRWAGVNTLEAETYSRVERH
jgi:hypothetical protein